MNTIAVGLMVKNESLSIERCLSSILLLKPDIVILVDTGSTDDTVVKAGVYLQTNNIKYKIYQESFVDFAYNRTVVLQLAAREKIDYVLMLDADETITYEDGFSRDSFLASLNHECYHLKMSAGVMSYSLIRLTSNKLDWKYIGVTHEYLHTGNRTKGFMNYISIYQHNDSIRRRTNQKFVNDIELLKAAIFNEKDEFLLSRYSFYLAQSYFANKNYLQALQTYKARIGRGGWEEEIFYSYYSMGKIYEIISPDNHEPIISSYLLAYNACPRRIESLAALKVYCDKKQLINLSNNLLLPLMKTIKHPVDGLFLEDFQYYAYTS